MKRQSSPALVLRRWPYSETSLAIRVLTPNYGTLSMLAKGAYKATSGMMGVLDTWALVEVDFASHEGAEMQNVYKARLMDRLSGLSANPLRLAASGVLAELAELASPAGQESTAPFIFLLRRLENLANGDEVLPLMVKALIQAIDLLGISPRFLPDAPIKGNLWFDFEGGGVLEPGAVRPHGHATMVQEELLRLLDFARHNPEEELNANDATMQEALTILGQFLHFHLERPPRAWDAFRQHINSQSRHEVSTT